MSKTRVFQTIRGHEETGDATLHREPAASYSPSYAEKLRLIGMHLDAHDMGAAKILDVPGGMLVRVVGPDRITDELIEFPDDIFPALYQDAIEHRGAGEGDGLMRIKSDLIPTSYADVLRSIGANLDAWAARSILISEGSSSMFVSGVRLENNSLRSTFAPFEEVLFPDDIDRLLTHAFRHRGVGA